MDLTPLAGMLFTLILIGMVGGFILLIPLSRRLGHMIDVWLQEKKRVDPDELAELRRTVLELEKEVSALAERQQFTDQLLEKRHQERLAP
jgi:hypothetical protein